MRCSVIIPVYRGERYLARTLQSLADQTYLPYEAIVVDDGSPDSSDQIANEFRMRHPWLRVISKKNERNVVLARQFGVGQLQDSCDAILFLDQDDLLPPTALEDLRNTLMENPRATASCGHIRLIDNQDKPIAHEAFEQLIHHRQELIDGRLAPPRNESLITNEALALRNLFLSPGQALIRRKSFDRAGGFDPAMTVGGFWDLSLRLCELGPVAASSEVTLLYRRHESNLSLDSESMAKAEQAVRRKHGQLGDPARRQLILAGWRITDREVLRLRVRWTRDAALKGQIGNTLRQGAILCREAAKYSNRWALGAYRKELAE